MNYISRIGSVIFVFTMIFFPFLTNAADPLEYDQWYLDRIGAKSAWTLTKGSLDVIVAVIDTGVDADHPDIKDNLWINTDEIDGDNIDNDKNGFIDDRYGWNFLNNTNNIEPELTDGYMVEAVQHGTFISGIISAVHDNNIAVKGITSKVKIMPLIALDVYGYGNADTVAAAIDYAVDNGASVVNLSFGGPTYTESFKRVITKAEERGVVIVAAAGNNASGGVDFSDTGMYPICYDKDFGRDIIVGVGSTDENDALSFYSNYGADCLDIMAPGDGITGLAFFDKSESDLQNQTVGGWRGTSFATAMVSGTVALMKSINKQITVAQVNEILKTTATNIDAQNAFYKGKIGAGLLNTFAAVEKTKNEFGSLFDVSLMIAARKDKPATVKIFDTELRWRQDRDIFGTDINGLNLAAADLNADGQKDLIVGAAVGNAPLVRGLSADDKLLAGFYAYEQSFLGGVNVAAGDLNGDGAAEYVTAPQSQKSALIKIFDNAGKFIKEFHAFDQKYLTGVSIAVADVVGDSKMEILVGAPKGALPQVKVFDFNGNLLKTINAFVPEFLGGVNVAAIDFDGQDGFEILVGAGAGSEPQVRVLTLDGQVLANFLAYDKAFRGGARLISDDLDSNGSPEIITVPGQGGGPHLRIFDKQGAFLKDIFPYEKDYTGGLSVAVID
jgi:hypothetical protein